jgi:hypothetical protein
VQAAELLLSEKPSFTVQQIMNLSESKVGCTMNNLRLLVKHGALKVTSQANKFYYSRGQEDINLIFEKLQQIPQVPRKKPIQTTNKSCDFSVESLHAFIDSLNWLIADYNKLRSDWNSLYVEFSKVMKEVTDLRGSVRNGRDLYDEIK